MGVEDYIRARTDQYYATNTRGDSPHQKKTQINDKFIGVNGFPPSRFMRPLPFQFQEAQISHEPQDDLQLALPPEKSIFDTDIENVDDSTITVTSIGDIEARDHGRGLFDRDAVSQGWDESVLSESDHSHQLDEEQVEVATTSKHQRKSTLPLSFDGNVYADGYDSQPFDWIQPETHRSTAVAKSKRNSVDKSNISRIPKATSRLSLQRSDSDPGARSRSQIASEREAASTRKVQVPYRSGYSRASNFPQSLATTPNNRFNFKTERPYERLIQQQSPTRRVSGPRPQPGRHDSTSPRKTGQTRQKHELASTPRKAMMTLDTTDDEDLDDEETDDNADEDADEDTRGSVSSINARSLTDDNTQRKISISMMSYKTDPKLTSDYPDEILQQMDFSELEKEPFDHVPSSTDQNGSTIPHQKITPPAPPSPPPQPTAPVPPPENNAAASEKLDYALNALSTPSERQQYMSSMNINEWEDFGDELIGHVGEMLKLIKESRQARRRTTALFEAEIRRRHDNTQNQSVDLDRKFAEMKQGGLGVLRSLNPTR